MKKATTADALNMALERIVNGSPLHVSPTARLSVSSVEKEAGLGNGSAYHYPDVVEKIKAQIEARTGRKSKSKEARGDGSGLQLKLEEERRLKEKYKQEAEMWRSRAESLAAQLHELSAANEAL